jgi:uncharacterized protein
VTADNQRVIQQTKDWIDDFVVGLQLCPFAASAVANDSIDYIVCGKDDTAQHLLRLADCFIALDKDTSTETCMLIFADDYQAFDEYLELLELGNALLQKLGYSGAYQLASFHPDYQFADSEHDDAANFSNRSPYPMLHILREHSIERAIAQFENIEQVPANNVKRLQQLGSQTLQQKLERILRGSR